MTIGCPDCSYSQVRDLYHINHGFRSRIRTDLHQLWQGGDRTHWDEAIHHSRRRLLTLQIVTPQIRASYLKGSCYAPPSRAFCFSNRTS